MSFGDKNWQPWVLDQEEAIPIIKYAFDRGINTWDVADAYSNGRSEEIIGNAIKKLEIPRSKLVIMTKCFHYVDETHGPISPGTFNINDGKQVNLVGLSRKHIMDAVDKSIERLGTYIDVLQVHRLDQGTPGEEIMKALNDVIESGKARYIGASSVRCPLLYCFHLVSLFSCCFWSSWLFASRVDTRTIDARLGVPAAPEYCRKA